MACTLAESPCDPLHRKLRQLRCLRCRFDCYRVERTSSRAGVAPSEVQRLSRRTATPTTRAVPKTRLEQKCGVHPLRTRFIAICALKLRLRRCCYYIAHWS